MRCTKVHLILVFVSSFATIICVAYFTSSSTRPCGVFAAATSTVVRKDRIKLFVGVLSRASNVLHRDVIRKTWGGHQGIYRLMFVVARPNNATQFSNLRREAITTRDVVIVGHIRESYYSISHQTFEVYRAAFVDGTATHVMKVLRSLATAQARFNLLLLLRLMMIHMSACHAS